MITCNFFVFGNSCSDDYNYNYLLLIPSRIDSLEKCNSSWGKLSDYNYISEFQEELILQNLHLQLHFIIRQEFKL